MAGVYSHQRLPSAPVQLDPDFLPTSGPSWDSPTFGQQRLVHQKSKSMSLVQKILFVTLASCVGSCGRWPVTTGIQVVAGSAVGFPGAAHAHGALRRSGQGEPCSSHLPAIRRELAPCMSNLLTGIGPFHPSSRSSPTTGAWPMACNTEVPCG